MWWLMKGLLLYSVHAGWTVYVGSGGCDVADPMCVPDPRGQTTIQAFNFTPETHQLTPRFSLEVGGIAAWLTLSKNGTGGQCLFGALVDKNQVTSFKVSPSGLLSNQFRIASGGLTPVHLHLIQNTSILLVANYHGPDDGTGPGGSVASFLVNTDCSLTLADSVPHSGSSVDPTRQNTAHPHSFVSDVPAASSGSVFAFACDLGMDRIFTYAVDVKTGQLKEVLRTPTHPGSGPRHSVVYQGMLYVLHEMGNFLAGYNIQPNGDLAYYGQVSSLPYGFTKFSKAAEIVQWESYLFVSNRGANTIAAFSDTLSIMSYNQTSSGGSYPRGLNVLVKGQIFWFVANQDSSSLALFSGKADVCCELTYLGVNISTPSPVTIAFSETS